MADSAQAFEPTLIVDHSMGGYLVQRHLETRPAAQAVLLGHGAGGASYQRLPTLLPAL